MSPSPAVHPLPGPGARPGPGSLSTTSMKSSDFNWDSLSPSSAAEIAPVPLGASILSGMESVRRQHEAHRAAQRPPTAEDDVRRVHQHFEAIRQRRLTTDIRPGSTLLGKRTLDMHNQRPPMYSRPRQQLPYPGSSGFFETPPATPADTPDPTPAPTPLPKNNAPVSLPPIRTPVPPPRKKLIVAEVIDVDDDDAMEALLNQSRSTHNPIAPIASIERGHVGGDKFVDAGGNLFSFDRSTGRIEISDSPSDLNASTVVGKLPGSSFDWSSEEENMQAALIPEIHQTPPLVQRFMNVPPPAHQTGFIPPKPEVVPVHDAFVPASAIPSLANYEQQAPEYNYSRPNPNDNFVSKEKLQDLVKANALTADATIEAETPEELNVMLMPHQRRALHWMFNREMSEEDEKENDDDIIAVSETDCRGGILADEQGLGKTLSVLSLILKNQPKPTEKDPAPPWKTLIVCPLSLVSQWKEEIETRIHDDYVPSIHVYHGQKRAKSARELEQYDIVLTTYATLGKEYPKIDKNHPDFERRKKAKLQPPRRRSGCAFRVNWCRIVLDEAHYIKNRSTDNFQAVACLKAKYRWCLTGTPIQNSVDDIYSLFVFIKYAFVPNYEVWNLNWKRKLENNIARIREKAFKCFQAIVGVVLLRRTKKDNIDGRPLIVLPERKSDLLEHMFDDEDEKSFYKAVQEKTVVAVNKFIVAGTLAHNYSSVLLLLLRLRQACCHPFLIEYAGMLGKRGKKSRAEFADFHSPHSDIALDEAAELLIAGHSYVSLLEEGARCRVRALLAPTEENMTLQSHFMCMRCRRPHQYNHGYAVPCGHFMCGTCGEQSLGIGACQVCANPITADGAEALIGLMELRMEVHATVLLGLKEDDLDYDLPTAGSLRAILKSRGKAAPKRMRHKQTKLDTYFGRKTEPENAGASALASFMSMAGDDGEVKDTPMKTKRSLDNFEISDDDKDFVHVAGEVKKEAIAPFGAGWQNATSHVQITKSKPEPMEAEIQIGSFYRSTAVKEEQSSGHSQLANHAVRKAKTESVVGGDVYFEAPIEANARSSQMDIKVKWNDNVGLPSDEDEKHAKEMSITEKLVRAVSQPSTKIRVLLEELAATRDRGNNEKTLVFSQWTTMLDIVEFHVEGAGYGVCRLDGSMQIARRKEEIHEFNTNEDKTVFLISLHAGGTGLNLTAASQVILCDVWWNPQTEEQAIDRVHRIGQKRDVRVCRFKMTGTVEDRIYDICARKKELADGMLGVSGAQTMGRKKLTLQEIMYMFGGAAMDVEKDAGADSEAAAAARNILNFTGGR